MNLRVPGPTPCPPEAMAALARPMIDHRGPEFAALIEEVTAGLKRVFKTQNDLLTLTASGSGGLEAAVVNLLSPGERVVVVSVGAFGDRFAIIARGYGASVRHLEFEWGKAADPAVIAEVLREEPEARVVFVTHNETSTGVTNDLARIAEVVKGAGRLLVVDGVSSVSSIDLETDRWGCDVVVSGSQKGWMVPPGLAFVSMSQAAWEAQSRASLPRFYFDLAAAKQFLAKGQTPYTPAISIFYALQATLPAIEAEGLDNVFARHRRVAAHTRAGVRALGLEPFADEAVTSATVTAVRVPQGVDPKALLRDLRETHGVALAGGQAKLDGQIFRIGHLGWVDLADIDLVLDALRQALPRHGHQVLADALVPRSQSAR